MTSVRDGSAIKAIETRYAGCHFRSRLEARWAVFFDHLGIKWQYEPQGFEVSWRLSLDDGVIRYLPDFYLPDAGCYAEVKGQWTDDECHSFLNAVASIAGPCGPDSTNFVVLPGLSNMVARSIQATGTTRWRPYVLHFHKGDLLKGPWDFRFRECGGYGADGWGPIATDVGGDGIYRQNGWDLTGVRHTLLDGTHRPLKQSGSDDNAIAAALTAARSARFEHGQSGAT
jgi:hypothetical protein